LLSCKKQGVQSDSEREILLSKSWKLAIKDKNVSSNPSGVILYAELVCTGDDRYKFEANNVLKVLKEKGNCFLYKPDDFAGSYNLSTRELSYDGSTYKIAEISANQIKFYRILPSTTNYQVLVYLLE
jgi:hypothetical protein